MNIDHTMIIWINFRTRIYRKPNRPAVNSTGTKEYIIQTISWRNSKKMKN